MANNNTNFVSPIGTAKYAWVTKPDTRFANGGEGQYKIRVLLDDTPENRAWAENVVETGKADGKTNGVLVKKKFNNPFKFPEDFDEEDFVVQDGKERAKYTEDYRNKIMFEAKSNFAPGLIDTARQELPEDVFVMSGDKVKVKFEVNPYEQLGSGISLRLKIVQLVEKNSTFTASGGGLNTEGFDDLAGFVVSDETKARMAKFKENMKGAEGAEGAEGADLQSKDPDLAFFDELTN